MPRGTRATKGRPFSIRLSWSTDQFVDDEARRSRRSKSSVVEALTEEAARMRRFPGIGFRGTDSRRRAWLIGTGLDVWQIIEAYQDFGSIERLVAGSDLGENQAQLALAYWEQYSEEIEEAVADNRRSPGEVRAQFPFIRVSEAG